jgi:hypothetical protein
MGRCPLPISDEPGALRYEPIPYISSGRPSAAMDPAVVERGRRPCDHVRERCAYDRRLDNNFYEAMAMAEHFGFRQGRQPEDFWTR